MDISLKKKEHSLWKNLLYSGSLETENIALLKQFFFINTFALLGFVSAFVFGTLHIFAKHYYVGFPEILGGIVFLLTILLLRVSKKLQLCKISLLITLGVLLIVMLATGGTAHTGIFWYFSFPVVAFFLMGKEKGTFWILSLYIVTLLLFILGSRGIVSVAYTFIEIRQLLASLLVTSILVYLYQSSIERTEVALEQGSDQLQIAKRAIEQEKVVDEALLASIGEGMIALGSSGEVLIINHAASALLKLEDNSIIGQNFSVVTRLKDAKGRLILDEQRPWYQAVHTGEKITGEYSLVRSDNSEIPIALVAGPVVLNDKIIGVIELFRDITEEKKLDQTKSEFVALASHQLRTPISAIAWFTEMLLHGDCGPLTDEQTVQLKQVYQSNKRMAVLVDELLNVSRVELGNFTVDPQPLNLVQISHTILTEELGKQKVIKNLKTKEEYAENLPSLSADMTIVRIIFQHLFANAIKYTPQNGTITIAIAPEGTSGLLFKISDTGYGIPKEQQGKVFSKLFRADNVKVKDTDGTGLGLYIVKSLVEETGGKIWFESDEGKGSTFFVLFPPEGMKIKKGEKLAAVKL
ncbi:MAG TPA: ATP-binding protein [Methylomirabilota bacterium]|nr:ATP-binding protein [Methylomirabilota bacterium]